MHRPRLKNTATHSLTEYLLLGLFLCLPGISRAAGPDEEAALRTAFTKQFKDKKAEARVEAVKTLAGVKQVKTISLLAGALNDTAIEVRTAAAETLEGVSDGTGVATRPLCAMLANKKDKVAVRLAAAKALAKSPYKADPIKALIISITIEEGEVALYDFGEACVTILNKLAGQDFGMDKDTPEKWAKWYKANEAKLLKQDQETHAANKGK